MASMNSVGEIVDTKPITDVIARAVAMNMLFPLDPKTSTVKELREQAINVALHIESCLEKNGYKIFERIG